MGTGFFGFEVGLTGGCEQEFNRQVIRHKKPPS